MTLHSASRFPRAGTGKVRLAAACLTFLAMGGRVDASVVINPGIIEIVQGTTVSVPINFTSSAPTAIAGMTLTVQIDDGLGALPAINVIDVLNQTVWTPNNSFDWDPSDPLPPQVRTKFVISDEFTLPASGRLANVTFSAVDAPLGDYVIRFSDAPDDFNPSELFDNLGAPIGAVFTQGTLRVVAVPEATVVGAACAFGWIVLRRGSKASRAL